MLISFWTSCLKVLNNGTFRVVETNLLVPSRREAFVKEDADLRWKLDALTRKVEALSMSQSENSANTHQIEGCSLCASPMH